MKRVIKRIVLGGPGWLLGLAAMTHPLGAQTQAPQAVPAPTPVSMSAMAEIATPADSFAAYVGPGECVDIVPRKEFHYWNTHRPDTVVPVPQYPPTPAARRQAVESAARCVARFSVAKSSVRDLLGLGRAYLGAEQPVQADSAFRRWLSLIATRPAYERRWALVQVVQAYLDARPADLTRALAYVAKLDALGPAAAPERLMVHLAVISETIHRDSVALQEREVTAALHASRELRGDSAIRYVELSVMAHFGLADLHARRGDGPGARRVLDEGEAELLKLCPSTVSYMFGQRKGHYILLSEPAPPLQVTRWFNDSSAGHRPVRGRRSLILLLNYECQSSECFTRYALLRRLRAWYPDLDITFIAQTTGVFGAHLVSPEQEMEMYRQYVYDQHRLPGALGIWQTVSRRRRVDRGLEEEAAPYSQTYVGVRGDAVLVDRQGIVRMYENLGPENENRWRNVIGEMP